MNNGTSKAATIKTPTMLATIISRRFIKKMLPERPVLRCRWRSCWFAALFLLPSAERDPYR
jgi:hypothetical protein